MAAETAGAAAASQAQAPAWRAWLIAIGVWAALAASVSVSLWHLRQAAVQSQSRELALLSLALGDAVGRGLRGADEGLQALRSELREGRLGGAGVEPAPGLKQRAGWMPLVDAIWLADASGRVLASSEVDPALVPPRLADFFPARPALAPDTAALSRPVPAPAGRGPWLAMAVPVAQAPGPGVHWILAALATDALLGTLDEALPAADARLWVFRADGARLAGVNVDAGDPGQPGAAHDEAVTARWPAAAQAVERRVFADGSDNLVAIHRVPRYGVRVVVSRDLAAVLAPWRESAEGAAVLLSLLLAALLAAVALGQRAERRRQAVQQALQAQRARSSKLESLGALAGSVAHDFNNVLAAIVGYGEMAQDAAAAGSAQARHLDRVLQAALRGRALVERVLKFSRGGARASTVFVLEKIVDEVLALLSARLQPGVVLARALDAPHARVRGDPTQAFEAVMNLCTNGIQAMPQGGTLSVQVQADVVPVPRVLSHTRLAAGAYIVVQVRDEGGGVPADVMEHLFEPFFTTRAAQSGTGLGLAVVHGAMAEFNGAIDVRSPPGQGACFALYFPQCLDAADAALVHGAGAAVGTGQRIAVLDDEPELVALAGEMLNALGYRAVGYTDPATALAAVSADHPNFAAVITDEAMPTMSGTQFVQALRAHAPVLPVLMVSGYGGALLAERAATAGVTRLLAKPLQRGELARALAELLR